jgi:hypothetical protein
MKWQTVIALLVFSIGPITRAQTSQETNTAPPPSPRFPASWYRSDDTIVTTLAPVKGAPYSATMFTTYFRLDSTGHMKDSTDEGGSRYRDSEGRTRTEEVQAGRHLLPDGSLESTYRQIEVNDPVSHCQFRWIEPWTAIEKPIAQVECGSRVEYYSKQDLFASYIAQMPLNDDRGQTTPLGHRTIEGFDTLGVQRVENSLVLITEAWYSPQLHELLRFGPVSHNAGLPTFELKNIHLSEPDPRLFYPPANYRILKPGETTR